jgi:hypothetical protein
LSTETSGRTNGGRWADRLEYQLELLGSVVLILVGVILWMGIGGKLGQAVGANLLAAGCVAFIVFLAYGKLSGGWNRARVEERSRLEATSIQRTIDAGLGQSLDEFQIAKEVGLTGFSIGRPTDLNAAVLQAAETLDILEISLKTMQGINTQLWRACEARIRILLLDPFYPSEESFSLAHQRDIEEGQGEGQILGEIHEILRIFPSEWFPSKKSDSTGNQAQRVADAESGDGDANSQREAEKASDEVRVKLAKAMPTMSYFRIDGIAYFAPLVHRQLGHETMHLRLSQGGLFFTALEKHFDKLWDDEKLVEAIRPDDIPPHYPR